MLRLGLGPALAISRSWPAASYLAVRRLARARAAALGLVAATAVAVGVLAYASTMDRSLQATLEAKAHTYVGSDVAVGSTTTHPCPRASTGGRPRCRWSATRRWTPKAHASR